VKRVALICAVIVSGCTSKLEAGCPTLERLAQRDAVADARTALAKGDRHLLMLGGFVGSVPGVENPGLLPTQMVEGTSDARTEACAQQRPAAEAYASRYNQTIIQATGG
jgi:hypothetical protein